MVSSIDTKKLIRQNYSLREQPQHHKKQRNELYFKHAITEDEKKVHGFSDYNETIFFHLQQLTVWLRIESKKEKK